MSIRHSLLAILALGDCYGNQLRHEFERRAGGAAPINVGQIYTTLDRLERDGLVRRSAADDQGHIVYAISPAGRAEVAAWMGSPLVRPSLRDDLAVKVAMAVSLPGGDAAALLERQGAASADVLATAEAARDAASGDLATAIVLDAAVEAARADVRWLEFAAARVAAAGDTGFALSAEVPKRGRPAKS